MRLNSAHSGYIFLLAMLTMGAILAATSGSLLLLGWAAEQNGKLIVDSEQALLNAFTCSERALRSLRSDPSYVGDTTITLTYGSCTLSAIGGSGNNNRTICATGTSSNVTRLIQISVGSVLPTTAIDSWQEVVAFTLCP